jgi:hypothetical protein
MSYRHSIGGTLPSNSSTVVSVYSDTGGVSKNSSNSFNKVIVYICFVYNYKYKHDIKYMIG